MHIISNFLKKYGVYLVTIIIIIVAVKFREIWIPYLNAIVAYVWSLNFVNQVQPQVDFGNIALIFLTALAFWVAYAEYKSNKRREILENQRELEKREEERSARRENAAHEIWRLYLSFALQYPKLSLAKYNKDDPIEEDQYDTFLSIMLTSFDEMTILNGRDSWAAVIKYQVRVHGDYLVEILHKDVSEEDSFRTAYGMPLLSIVDEAFSEFGLQPKKGSATQDEGK